MDSVGSKLDLTEMGTRYNHYMELKEVFMTGIEVITNMLPQHLSDGDRLTKTKLEHAVEVIDKRLLYLSDYGTHTLFYNPLQRELREIDKQRREIRRHQLEAKNATPQDPSPSSTPQDSEGEANKPE